MNSDEALSSLFTNLDRFGFVQIEGFAVVDGNSQTYFITLQPISSFVRFKFYGNDYQIIESCSLFDSKKVEEKTKNTLSTNDLKVESIAYVFNDQELDIIVQIFSTTNHLAYTFTSINISENEVSLKYDLEDNANLDEFLIDYNDVIELHRKDGKKVRVQQPTAQSLVRKLKLKNLEVE